MPRAAERRNRLGPIFRGGVWLLAALVGCAEPNDVLFTPLPVEPIAEDGRFRLTGNQGPDLVRGFTPDGARIVYVSRGLAGFGEEWRILSIPAEGGAVREEAAIYRAAIEGDSLAQLVFDPGGRVLVSWKPAVAGIHGCGPPAPAGPNVIGLTLRRLDPEDGRALSSIPTRFIATNTVFGAATASQRIRILPVEGEIKTFGAEPFGPAVSHDGSGIGFISDGEAVWRVDLNNPTAPAESIGPGAFPALSADDRLLAVAVPTGVDSVITTVIVPAGLGACVQVTIAIMAAGWEIVLYDLSDGSTQLLAPGTEPRFHPATDRLLVRRVDGLYWVDLGTAQATLIPGTVGGHSPALSPDGSLLAFSAASTSGSQDVFFVPLN